MTLLYLTLAYMLGLLFGRIGWEAGWIGCNFPDWLWWLPLLLLPVTPLLNWFSLRSRQDVALRWPAWAGFEPPRSPLSPALGLALFLCSLTGLLRYGSHPLQPCWTPADLAYYNLAAERSFDKSAPEVTVTGYVSSYPLLADTKQQMYVTVAQLIDHKGAHAVQGVLRLTTNIRQIYVYGQPVRLRGRLVTPPDFADFSYREYLARKDVHSLFYSTKREPLNGPNGGHWWQRSLYQVRARGEAFINRSLPEPYAGLANGILLGIGAGIDEQLNDKFNLTGTSHVLVISGANVALIAAVLMGISQRALGRSRALWPTLIGIVSFALLVGGDPSVLRAAWMGGLYVIATTINRRSTALVSLAVACWMMTLVNPLTLWDVGFQLSSGATASLILFTPGLTAWFSKLGAGLPSEVVVGSVELTGTGIASTTKQLLWGLIEDGLLVTMAANVLTLPLVVYYFARLSLVALLTNFLILPVQPLIMLGGSAAVAIGVIGLTGLAQLLLWVPWLGLVWTVGIVQWTATLPLASLDVAGYGSSALVLTFLGIFMVHWRVALHNWGRHWFGEALRKRLSQWPSYLVGPITVGGLTVVALLIWALALSQPDGRLHVYFLDIGQGDGILIQTPSGRQVLIDGGASPQQLFSQLGAVMPFWQRTIDIAALTNPDKDHMDAQAQTPNRFRVTTGLSTVAGRANHDSDSWYNNIVANGGEVQLYHEGGWFDLGDGVALWVLWPPVEPVREGKGKQEQAIDNENSLVMKLVYGDFSVLLTGDAGLPSELALLAAGEPVAATVLKVGHHGSRGSTSHTFVQAVNPLVAVIQCGLNNQYGHPTQEVLDRLAGRLILRNDLQGRIHIYSDGRQMWLTTEKSAPAFNS
ncbi:MAG: ComEC/Rec2 family competence protein [Chloroflexi bacterium]|nr:ComEC/Rec2 family competence protein [Chloroflexota bacterium]